MLDPGSLAEWVAIIATVVVGVYAALLAWKASKNADRTALRVSSFDHTDKFYAAMRRHAKLVRPGEMPQVMQGWNPGGFDTDAGAATFEYLDALEMLFFAVEEGAADPRIARRFVQPLIDHPQEILESVRIYRRRSGDPSSTYEAIERTLTRGTLVVPTTWRTRLWRGFKSWL